MKQHDPSRAWGRHLATSDAVRFNFLRTFAPYHPSTAYTEEYLPYVLKPYNSAMKRPKWDADFRKSLGLPTNDRAQSPTSKFPSTSQHQPEPKSSVPAATSDTTKHPFPADLLEPIETNRISNANESMPFLSSKAPANRPTIPGTRSKPPIMLESLTPFRNGPRVPNVSMVDELPSPSCASSTNSSVRLMRLKEHRSKRLGLRQQQRAHVYQQLSPGLENLS